MSVEALVAHAFLDFAGTNPARVHLPAPVDTGSGVLLAARPVSYYVTAVGAAAIPVVSVVVEFLDSTLFAEASIVGYLVPA